MTYDRFLKSNYSIMLRITGTSLADQWLRLRASTAGGMGSVPGGVTKIPHGALRSQTLKN